MDGVDPASVTLSNLLVEVPEVGSEDGRGYRGARHASLTLHWRLPAHYSKPPLDLTHFRCRLSRSVEEALTQQVELGAAIHLAFQALAAVDMALGLAVAPHQSDGCL